MLDFNLIKADPQQVAQAMAKRGFEVDFTEVLGLDGQRRSLIADTEAMKAERNRISAQIPQMKKQGQDVQPIFAQMRELGDAIKANDDKLQQIEGQIRAFLEALPNIPDSDIPSGGKENNRVISVWGQKPVFDFEPQNHVDLATRLGLIDYPRGAKLAGSGYWLYTGDGARLEWALVNYFISRHVQDGWQFILPPHQLTYQAGYTAGQFPKFDDEVYWLNGTGAPDQSFMLPTAETALVNLHRDEILDAGQLPLKYVAYTPCYRLEAGSYRAEERGMIRGHQFNKVEMVQYTLPEDSDRAFEEMVGRAQMLVQELGLHYRLSQLAAGDCSHSMARTYDIEIWIPSMQVYKEVSSASNARDYQARRGNMRVRRAGEKPIFMHTLNASGLATSRVFPAILEQYQQRDGSVIVPKVLVPFMGGQEILRPRA
nr:serine--tRNA ligase [bacterium]